jgi:hypothetical protein
MIVLGEIREGANAMSRRAWFVLALLLVFPAAARAQFCPPGSSADTCQARLLDLTFEGWVAVGAVRLVCPNLITNRTDLMVADTEKRASQRERERLVALHRAVLQRFKDDPERACRTAYALYGPGGSMTSLMAGPLVRLRPLPVESPPASFEEGFQRE